MKRKIRNSVTISSPPNTTFRGDKDSPPDSPQKVIYTPTREAYIISAMKLGIVGSRRRNGPQDKAILRDRILALDPSLIISGGCASGADHFAEELAAEFSISIKIFYPEKVPLGSPRWAYTRANYARNELIAKNSDHLIALVASDRKGGTENTISFFTKYKGEKDLEIL